MDGEARALLEALLKTFKKTAAGGKLADRKYRIAAADGMDAEIAELFERDYTGKSKTVSGYAKRHRGRRDAIRRTSGVNRRRAPSRIICRAATAP